MGPSVDSDWSVLCQTLCDGVAQGDWVTMYNVLRDAAKDVGIKKVGERTSLLWKLSEKNVEGKTDFGEDLKGEVEHRLAERTGRVSG